MKTNALKAEMAKNGVNIGELAKHMGIGRATMGKKLRTGKFGLDEVNEMIRFLKIENPAEIFF